MVSSCKDLIKIISLYFNTLHCCIVKEEYDYLRSDPPMHKDDRCSSSVYLILRILIGKKVYKEYKSIDSLFVTRIHELEYLYDSLQALDSLKNHLFSNQPEHIFFVLKLVRRFDGVYYTDKEKKTILPCHYFIIEKNNTSNHSSYNLYQSYVDDYSLNDFLNYKDSSLTRDDILTNINLLKIIFSSKKWSKRCSDIWKYLFLHQLSPKLNGLTIPNNLFFIYQTFPITQPKKQLKKFIINTMSSIENKKETSLYDLPQLFKKDCNITIKQLKQDLSNLYNTISD